MAWQQQNRPFGGRDMSSATVEPSNPSRGFASRDIEILLSAMAKDLMARRQQNSVQIDDGEETLHGHAHA